ncbi:MAG: hypothetical protein ACYTDW_01335 [Planctomycetota bacterium]|jgi:hypothetical protein
MSERTYDVGTCKYCYKTTYRGVDPYEDVCAKCDEVRSHADTSEHPDR